MTTTLRNSSRMVGQRKCLKELVEETEEEQKKEINYLYAFDDWQKDAVTCLAYYHFSQGKPDLDQYYRDVVMVAMTREAHSIEDEKLINRWKLGRVQYLFNYGCEEYNESSKFSISEKENLKF